MEESLGFYQEIVGLSLNKRYQAGPAVEIAFLGEGDTQVELICVQGEKAVGCEGVSLGFIVPSLDEKMRFIEEKGLPVDSGPFQPNPHIRFLFVRDPNGVKIQFVENIK